MKSMLGIFWLMVVIGVMGIIFVGSEPNTNSKQEDHNSSPTEHNGDAHSLASKESNKEAEGGTKYHKQENGGGAIRRALVAFMDAVEARDKFFTAFGTIIIAGFTVGLACATLFLYWATKDLVKGADETAERQLRAYVGIHSMETTMYPFEGGGYAFIAHAEIRNFGQTPAYRTTMVANAVVDAPEAIPFNELQGNSKSAGASTMFRDVGLHIQQYGRLSDDDFRAINEQRKMIFFWGTVKYRDAFKKERIFRFRLITNAKVIGTQNIWSMAAHPLAPEEDDE